MKNLWNVDCKPGWSSPQAKKCGQSYLCDRKNKPWVTSPNTEKANRKLTARNIAKPPCRRDPTSHSVLVTAASSAVRLQGRGKDCRDADAAKSTVHITCARYGTAPNLGERPCSGKQRRSPLRPKVRPDERPCNYLCASQRQMVVPTDEEAPRREPMIGANAKSRVGYGENHCASPTTSVAFTLPKQCQRLLTPNCDWIMMWTYK